MFNFKKIASVASSALMIGSTVALAAAANYPAPFVQNGAADVAIVTGQNAASSDTTAAVALSSDLSAALASQGGSSSSGATPTGGDSFQIRKSSDEFNLRDTASSVLGSATLTADDLPEVLADGTYENDENTEYEYEQKIALGGGLQLNYFKDSDFNDDTPSIGINLSSSQDVFNYTLDFTTNAESDISSGDLVDLETTTLKMLGRDYYILDAKNNTGSNSAKLTLLDSAATAIAREGETTSVTIGSKTYQVQVVFISTTNVKLSVDGQVTTSLTAGGTYRLSDGTYIGIKEILARDVAGVLGQVEFSIGSGKLEIENGQTIQLNDDSVDAITGWITKTETSSKVSLDKIVLQWRTDDEAFVGPDNDLVIPGFGNVKLSMSEFYAPGSETTVVRGGSNTHVELATTIKDGAITVPLLFANANGGFAGIGKDASNRLATSNRTTDVLYNYTGGDRMMIASWNGSSEAETYALVFSNWVNDSGTLRVDVKNDVTGAVKSGKAGGDSLDFGSMSLTISSITRQGSDKWVTLNGSSGVTFNTLYTKSGLKIALPFTVANSTGAGNAIDGAISFNNTDASTASAGHSNNTFVLYFTDENKDDDLGLGSKFNVTLDDNSDNEPHAASFDVSRGTFTDPADSNTISAYTYDDVATKVMREGASSDQRKVTVTYAGGESYGKVFVSASGVTFSGGSDGGVLGSVVITDSQASSASSKNLIVVGGSCVNTVAAQLLGASAPACGADFTSRAGGVSSGQFLIQSFTSPLSSSKVALLVAGYNAEDTQNAATYLRTNKPDTAVGKKYVGTTATSAQLVTA
jgi:hypothetical protein